MPDKKTGTAISPKDPIAPAEALEAMNTEPGAVSSHNKDAATPASYSITSTEVGAMPPAGQEEQGEQTEDHWISVELKGDKDEPVPDEQYRIKLADGTIHSGYTDAAGKALVKGLPQKGNAEINFPRIHGDEWKPV